MLSEDTTVRSLLASPAAFRAWLQDQSPYSVAGVCGLPDGCPIAAFLLARTQADYVSVGVYSVILGHDEVTAHQHILSRWCTLFVSAVDKAGLGHLVTAAEALDVVDGIRSRLSDLNEAFR